MLCAILKGVFSKCYTWKQRMTANEAWQTSLHFRDILSKTFIPFVFLLVFLLQKMYTAYEFLES